MFTKTSKVAAVAAAMTMDVVNAESLKDKNMNLA